jgi:WhiB family redox-sensing transcriptional regulator
MADDLSWRDDGACGPVYKETGIDLWYGPADGDPDHREGVMDKKIAAEARKVCRTCTVRQECLTYAFANGETDGIWGGLTPYDRTALKNKVLAERAAKREGVAA